MPLYITLVLLAVLTRLVAHIPNVAPIGALALFMGTIGLQQTSTKNKVAAFLVPLFALFISDAMIGFYSWKVMLAVYGSFALTIVLGAVVRKWYSWPMIIGASLVGSIIFFLVTNAAVWAFTPLYAKTFAGLMQSYAMALPFFRNSLLGDLMYTSVLFGAYQYAQAPLRQTTKLAAAHS